MVLFEIQIRWGVANARQFVFYLGRIVVDVESSTERIALLDQRLLSQLAELQSMIGDSAQPWASVSPLFTNLAATWTSLQVIGGGIKLPTSYKKHSNFPSNP